MRPVRSLFLMLATLVAVLLPAASAAALSYPVTSTADSESKGTLRTSIKEANAHMGADSIPIEVTGTIELESALQIIFDPVSITGPGASQLQVRRAGSAPFPVFAFSSIDPSALSGLTVSNGRAIGSGGFVIGGGIRNSEGSLTLTGVAVRGSEALAEGGAKAVAEGGGVYSEGPLTLRESVVAGNVARARDGTSETASVGGGVAALSSLTVERSTISGNLVEATGGDGVARARGGGLLAPEVATIRLSTISGNSARAEDGGTLTRAEGGGVDAHGGSIEGSTLTGNSATSSGEAYGANVDSFFTTAFRDSIVSRPLGDAESCDGTAEIVSGGFNLDEDGSCGLAKSSDLAGVAAGLDPVLADNGGPTPTHALLTGSIAIDRGNSFGASTDQRGLPRPSDFPSISNKEGGDGSDIGAFELQVPSSGAPNPILVSAERGDTTPPRTRIVSGPARVGYERGAKFRFVSSEGQSTFQCKLDKRRWKRCRSPHKVSVRPGKHLLKVRAIDRFGNADATPARFSWRVKPLS